MAAPKPPSAPVPPRRARVWMHAALLLAAVLALHLGALLLLRRALPRPDAPPLPQPLYTHLLRPTAPHPATARPPAPHPPPARPPVAAPKPAAAGPVAAPPRPASAAGPGSAPHHASAPAAPARGASPATRAASAASAPGAAASAPRPTAWPPSTQLSYALSGAYHGPLHGSGELTWIRDGDRYQATLSGQALIGFSYASRGHIDGEWLAPDDYEERVFTRHQSVHFDRAHGLLSFSAIPTRLPLPSRLQDSASVFMQLAHLLERQPEQFAPGQHIGLELARPSGTTTWDFTVTGMDTVRTRLGPLPCWHLVYPADSNNMGAEVWLAPGLQNLPVQIRLQRGDEGFLLFTLREARQS